MPIDPSPDLEGGIKRSKFNLVMLHMKLKGMMNAAACKHIFCPCTHPVPLGWGQKSKQILSSVTPVCPSTFFFGPEPYIGTKLKSLHLLP